MSVCVIGRRDTTPRPRGQLELTTQRTSSLFAHPRDRRVHGKCNNLTRNFQVVTKCCWTCCQKPLAIIGHFSVACRNRTKKIVSEPQHTMKMILKTKPPLDQVNRQTQQSYRATTLRSSRKNISTARKECLANGSTDVTKPNRRFFSGLKRKKKSRTVYVRRHVPNVSVSCASE